MTRARAIAAAQTIPVRGDVDANVASHVRLATAAADLGVALLVFPELSLTGYELDLADELAFSETDPRLGPLVELSATRALTLVVGAPVRAGPRLFLGALILAPDGSVELYTKHHLGAFPSDASPDGVVPPAEATVFEPGDRNPLVHVACGTAAVAVCADTGRPSHAARAAERGATAYLASMFVIPTDLAAESARLRAYAERHSMTVVLANYGGPTGGLAAGGGSAIWSERGEPLVRLGETGSGLAIAVADESGWRGEAVPLD